MVGCVPTIFLALLRYADEHPEVDLSSLTNAACGGSAVPRQLMKDFEERHDVRIFQAWGMTETSPVATYSRPARAPSTTTPTGTNARCRGARCRGSSCAWPTTTAARCRWDGTSTGEIEVRGPWIASRYFADSSEDEKFATGWLRTGDIASVDEGATVQITDRSKDVIKSGGEWISSVELENELMSHPDVRRGGRHRQARRALGRAPAVLRRAARGRRRGRARAGRAPARQGRQVVAPGRVRVRRRDPQDERRQVRQEGAARTSRRGHARGPRAACRERHALERTGEAVTCAARRGERDS